MLLSLLLTFAPLCVSACDLSCWLQRGAPDCHGLGSAADNIDAVMTGASGMDMSSGMDARQANKQNIAGPEQAVGATTHHSMPPQMYIGRGSGESIPKSDANANASFDHSNTLSPCRYETCAQGATSSSPPNAGKAQPASFRSAVIHALHTAEPSTAILRAATETSSPIGLPADRLFTLRI